MTTMCVPQPTLNPYSLTSPQDEGFGPFSDAHATSASGASGSGEGTSVDGEDPFSFSFSSSVSDDGSFDAFGDFGEFQSAPDGEGEGEAAGLSGEGSENAGKSEGEGEEADLTPTTPTGLTESWAFAGGEEGTAEKRGC
ncbi:hypothetical protein AX15_000840 [Amanita polypyramis BW_CC]|nr:hypothetical protein AX15_000840 [Amanita polypyramis BW_CC]